MKDKFKSIKSTTILFVCLGVGNFLGLLIGAIHYRLFNIFGGLIIGGIMGFLFERSSTNKEKHFFIVTLVGAFFGAVLVIGFFYYSNHYEYEYVVGFGVIGVILGLILGIVLLIVQKIFAK